MANSNSTQKSWGGQWTEDKLDCFQKYVKAYLTIMNAYREKFRWKLVYFDGFAGSGSREQSLVTDEKAMLLFGEELHDASELHPYQGAAERVVQIEQQMRGFDEYWFIDKNEQNITSLELKLAEYQTRGKKMFRPNDANEEVLNLGRRLREHPKTKVLCLLDPFGMSINWDSIVALAGNGIDLWILVPTGSIVNRLIQKNGELRYPEKLEDFFGLPQQVIFDRFYEKKEAEANLFDMGREEVRKVKNIIGEIDQLYRDQLGQIFPYVTPEPLVMRNSRGLPIFHFVCASHNETAVKIAQQIINKKQKR